MSVRGLIDSFSTRIDGSISNSTTSITVLDASGISAGLSSADYIPLTINDGTNIEIIYCTGVSTNTLTVQRGKEGTTGHSFSDAKIQCLETREAIKELAGFELIKTTILGSDSTNVDFNVSSGSYLIRFDGVFVDGASDPDITVRQTATAGSYAGNGYAYGKNVLDSSGNTGSSASNASSFLLLASTPRGASSKISGTFEVDRVEENVNHGVRWNVWRPGQLSVGHGFYNLATMVIAEFRISCSLTNGLKAGSKFYLFRKKG